MSPERLARQQTLIGYVVEEFERYKSGGVERLSSSRELAEKFGYAIQSNGTNQVPTIMRKSIPEIYYERKDIIKPIRKRVKLPPPSSELAWVLGAVCGAGISLPTLGGSWHFSTVEQEFAENFRFLAKNLFQHEFRIQFEQRSAYVTRYYIESGRRDLSEFFGHISRTAWPDTIQQSHSWLRSQDVYLREFLSGYFDGRGSINPAESRGGAMRFSTSSRSVSFFIADILTQLGMKRIIPDHKNDKGALQISNYPEIIKLARLIHSSITWKEQRLDSYRHFRPYRKITKYSSDEDLIEDYRLARLLILEEKDQLPNTEDIKRLKRRGRLRFLPQMYARHFGGGSFVAAINRLEEIIKERGL